MKQLSILLILFLSATLNAQELSVENIWRNYAFYSRGVSGFNSMNDGKHFTKINSEGEYSTIEKFSFNKPKEAIETLFDYRLLEEQNEGYSIGGYEFNETEDKLLLMTNSKSIYRRSFTADYWLYDFTTKKLEQLDAEHSPQRLATYSPNGKMVAYIFENNLYVKHLESGRVTQITQSGKPNEIIHGTTDWVYEEEFAITKAFDWSPDSKNIAYLTFDESDVKEFTMTYHNELYPELYTFKYPKAGEDNSKVSLHICNIEKMKTEDIQLGDYEYIPRLKFANEKNHLVVQTLNRHQNHLKYHLIDGTSGNWNTKVFFEEKDEAYVEIDNNLLLLKDGKTILRTSEADGYNHVYSIDFSGKSTQITKGNWDVIDLKGIDEDKNRIYYTSAETGTINMAIYSIGFDGTKKSLLSPETGHHNATFSKGMKYFVRSSSSANTPPVYTLCNQKGKELLVLEDNENLKGRLSKLNLSDKEFMQIDGPTGKLNAWMIKPHNFDPNKKYPVYVNIYGGPGHNMVVNQWEGNNYMWHQLLASKGYIVFSVDPRGTYYRGADFKKSTYLQMGRYETEDFLAAAEELGKMSFVDKNRIGIQGWSYGGFMTSLCMTKGEGLYKMGIAVAPVTSWRYYDNIYTERFMRTPQENASGYDDNSPLNFADKLEGKYFLIHGSGDDNVHHQNAMEMVKALVKADKQFDFFIYPNKNHGIYGGNTRNHLFKMMLNYTLENL